MATFKKPRRNLRKREHSSSEEDEDFTANPEEVREMQRHREKPKGVSAASLALGKKIPKTEEVRDADPFKMSTGGFVDMKALKKKPLTGEVAEAIGTAFAAETNRRDEDAEMLKYVEEELAKRKGKELRSKEDGSRPIKPDDMLYQLPEHLQVNSNAKRSEDMLSNQMLSGIPEIDLGIEAKIKNIEATEDAKQKLLEERMRKREEVSHFVPTNIAVNFVQHNRFNIENTNPVIRKVVDMPQETKPLRVGESGGSGKGEGRKAQQEEKATDDFHYEKFKKQMRRY